MRVMGLKGQTVTLKNGTENNRYDLIIFTAIFNALTLDCAIFSTLPSDVENTYLETWILFQRIIVPAPPAAPLTTVFEIVAR